MRTILFDRFGAMFFAAVAPPAAITACLLDFLPGPNLGTHPITNDIIAGIMLLPLEILITTVVVGRVLASRERRRWTIVTDALIEAIDQKWNVYSEHVRSRYRGLHGRDAEEKIRNASLLWANMHDREVEIDSLRFELGTENYPIPENRKEILAAVHGMWLQMWGAGAEDHERALSRRLTQIPLPRLPPNNPEITAAVRTLIDAVEDLNDQRAEHDAWIDPFPLSPYIDDPDYPGQNSIPHGIAMVAGEALDELQDLLRRADHAIETGDRLVATLSR